MALKNNNSPFDSSIRVPERSWRQKAFAASIIISLLLTGIGISYALLKNKPKARKRPPVKMKTLVRVKSLKKSDVPVTFSAYGKVIPSKEISLTPQVSGRVIAIHKNFRPGGYVKKGEVLVTIDDRDLRSVFLSKKALYDQAVADLNIEEGNQSVAKNEWQAYRNLRISKKKINSDLILRKPQLKKAEAVVASAKADLEKARLDLSRTKVMAPFNAQIQSKNVDVGSQVSTQSAMATLTGTKTYWVRVTLPVERLKWLVIRAPENKRSEVIIIADEGSYKGQILALEGDLEQNGLMAKILVGIRNPLQEKTPLLLGSFVRAEFHGKTIKNVFMVSRDSLTENNEIFISLNNLLIIRKPSIIWKDTEKVYISDGLEEGELLITSKVPAPVEGMLLEIINGKNTLKKKDENKRGKK